MSGFGCYPSYLTDFTNLFVSSWNPPDLEEQMAVVISKTEDIPRIIQGSLNYTIQCNNVVILRDFPYNSALFGLVR